MVGPDPIKPAFKRASTGQKWKELQRCSSVALEEKIITCCGEGHLSENNGYSFRAQNLGPTTTRN